MGFLWGKGGVRSQRALKKKIGNFRSDPGQDFPGGFPKSIFEDKLVQEIRAPKRRSESEAALSPHRVT